MKQCPPVSESMEISFVWLLIMSSLRYPNLEGAFILKRIHRATSRPSAGVVRNYANPDLALDEIVPVLHLVIWVFSPLNLGRV